MRCSQACAKIVMVIALVWVGWVVESGVGLGFGV